MAPPRTRFFRLARAAFVAAVLLTAWHFLRPSLRPPLAPPDAATKKHLANVRIFRDTYGVPHIFGKTDADAAFGLAWAHAEDDFKTVHAVMAASKGQLGYVLFDQRAPLLDYYAALVRAQQQAREDYPKLAPDTRAVLEGYARGLNHYAYTHPAEADARIFPITGKDLASGFVHKLSIMVNVPGALETLGEGAPKKTGDAHASLDHDRKSFPGSNAHAVHRARSADDVTRLNVNSHQPWEGPVAWYEAQVVSEEGWNMTGGTFPGAPVILHGHNEHLGWAHTVNFPDVVDVFDLTVDPAHPDSYLLDGAWVPFQTTEAALTFDTGLADVTVTRKVQWTEHGLALELNGRTYAVRYAAMDRGVFAAEQWYRMNKAHSLEAWNAAMAIHAIPMFHTVYADRDNIQYLYNARLPVRVAGPDYSKVLPGDRRDVIWQGYLPFEKLPRVVNPPSGFVQACNSAPWVATVGEGNPTADGSYGIETVVTNRTRRSLELLGTDEKVDRALFEKVKWDRKFHPESDMFKLAVTPALAALGDGANADEKKAVELLRGWDGEAREDSAAATLAILTFKALVKDVRSKTDPRLTDAGEAVRDALAYLKQGFGRVDVPLGEVQRLRRGNVDLPLGGGPELLNAIYSDRVDGRLVGTQGDSYVLLVEFGPSGASSRSLHVYGASSREESKHYNDQASLFAQQKLKPTWRTKEELRAHLEREYAPGE
jgi:acyl-homoserine-lactone acylase